MQLLRSIFRQDVKHRKMNWIITETKEAHGLALPYIALCASDIARQVLDRLVPADEDCYCHIVHGAETIKNVVALMWLAIVEK